MSVLAANIEADALSMVLQVYNAVDDNANALTYKDIALGRRMLNQNLAPDDGERVGVINSQHVPSYLDAIKGLFNPQEGIARPYLTGKIGRVNNMNTYENTVLTSFQTGTALATTGYTATLTAASATVAITGTTTTFLLGDIVTFAGVNAVHPETKASLGYLQQFVVTANSGASPTSIAVSPTPTLTGPAQNVSSLGTSPAVSKIGGGVSALYAQSVLFHPEAFAFVTADLIDVSKFGAWGAREVMDGISMRIARQYDITNDQIPCRIDVLYGYKCIRPQLAVRVIAQ
jgi:hypothetical protein